MEKDSTFATRYSSVTIVCSLLLIWFLLSCKKEYSCESCLPDANKDTNNVNKPPIALAGTDQVISLPKDSALLDGTASSDVDGTILVYKWSKISGPSSSVLVNSTSPSAIVKNLAAGMYLFELKVTDNGGLSSADTVQVTALPITVISPCNIANRPLITAQMTQIGTLSNGGIAIGAAGNKILFAGANDFNLPNVDIYDISTQSWSTARLSTPRADMTALSVGNKIFFAGGWADTSGGMQPFASGVVDIYDASTNTWTATVLSEGRVWMAATSLGNKVFFGGGYKANGFQLSNKVDIYDLSTSQWSMATLSQARDGMTANAVNGKVYFAGGNTAYLNAPNALLAYPTDRIDIYDGATNSWSIDQLSEPKWTHASIVAGNKIYWAGGVTHASSVPSIASSKVEIRDASTQGVSIECLFQVNAGIKAVLKNNKIVFFTGVWGPSVINKFDIYDIGTGTWSIGVLPMDIQYADIISVNNTIYVAGGRVNGVDSDKVWRLDF